MYLCLFDSISLCLFLLYLSLCVNPLYVSHLTHYWYYTGKRVLADEFFTRHRQDLHNFGENFAQRSHAENVEKLVNAYSFERTYGQLLQVERTLKAESGKPLLDCIRNDDDEAFQRHKYYRDHMDSTGETTSCCYIIILIY